MDSARPGITYITLARGVLLDRRLVVVWLGDRFVLQVLVAIARERLRVAGVANKIYKHTQLQQHCLWSNLECTRSLWSGLCPNLRFLDEIFFVCYFIVCLIFFVFFLFFGNIFFSGSNFLLIILLVKFLFCDILVCIIFKLFLVLCILLCFSINFTFFSSLLFDFFHVPIFFKVIHTHLS